MLNWLLPFAGLVLLQSLPAQQMVQLDLSRADLVALEETVFVGQHVPIQLDLWIDAEFQQQQLVSLFRQPLDVPVELRWPTALGMAPIHSTGDSSIDPTANHSASGIPLASLVVDGQLHHAEVLADRWQLGRRQHGYRIKRTWIVAELGEQSISVEARYGFATRFRDDLINGRVAEDQQVTTVASSQLVWQIEKLPEQGRPPQFTGAIGQFSIQAELNPSADDSTFILALTLQGRGNWGAFAPPPWPVGNGFHCLGIREDQQAQDLPGQQRFYYDLKALETAGTIPGLVWSYFAPNWPAGYRTIQSIAFALDGSVVGVLPTQQAPVSNPSNSASSPVKQAETELTSTVVAILLLFPWALLAAVLWRLNLWRKRALGKQSASIEPAHLDSHNQAEQWDADAQRLAEELANNLRCLPAALICPNLVQRLRRSGIEAQLAAEAAEAFEQLIAARYGGPNGVQQPADVDQLLQRLRAASSPT